MKKEEKNHRESWYVRALRSFVGRRGDSEKKNNSYFSRRKILNVAYMNMSMFPFTQNICKNEICVAFFFAAQFLFQFFLLLSLSLDVLISFIDKIVTHLEENYKRYPYISSSLRNFALYIYIYAVCLSFTHMNYMISDDGLRSISFISDDVYFVVFACVCLLFEFYLFTCDVEVIWKRNNHSV